MGDRTRSCQTTAHAGYYGVHVWKFATDLFHHDGLDGKENIGGYGLAHD